MASTAASFRRGHSRLSIEPELHSPQVQSILLDHLAGYCLDLRAPQPVFVAGDDELAEERVGLEGLGFELGVELAAEEVGVAGDLDDLDVGVRRGWCR